MHNTKDKQCIRINNSSDKLVTGNTQLDSLTPTVDARIAKVTDQSYQPCQQRNQQKLWHRV
jgi:hypothetical protein